MISNRPMIPMLTHVDNLGDLNLDMTTQEQSLERIASNTSRISDSVDNIDTHNTNILAQTDGILQEMTVLNPTVSEINLAVGKTGDADTKTTVIGLLKSIVNKLS